MFFSYYSVFLIWEGVVIQQIFNILLYYYSNVLECNNKGFYANWTDIKDSRHYTIIYIQLREDLRFKFSDSFSITE